MTQAFLVESPEPIDFTTEVAVTLEQSVRQTAGGGLQTGSATLNPLLGDLVAALSDRPATIDPLTGKTPPPIRPDPGDPPLEHSLAGTTRHARLSDLARLGRLASQVEANRFSAQLAALTPTASVGTRSRISASVIEMERREDGIFARLHPERGSEPMSLRGGDRLVFAEILPQMRPGEVHVRHWSGRAAQSGATIRVDAKQEGVTILRGQNATGITVADRARLTGLILAIDPTRGSLIGSPPPQALGSCGSPSRTGRNRTSRHSGSRGRRQRRPGAIRGPFSTNIYPHPASLEHDRSS
jgi:hypothetical protein